MRTSLSRPLGIVAFVWAAAAFVACGGVTAVNSNDGGAGTKGHAGTSGSAGTTGAAGTGTSGGAGVTGEAGTNGGGGVAGGAGSGGGAGTTGSAGATGAAGAGTAGTTGGAGTMGHAGTTGSAGATGAAGTMMAGTGSAGTTGAAGTGAAGTGAAGTTGAAGSGAAGTGGGGCQPSIKICCTNNNQCAATEECVGGSCGLDGPHNGVCKPLPSTRTSCWSKADCPLLMPVCNGAVVCPCNARCVGIDKEGTCGKLLVQPIDPPVTTN